MTGAALEIAEKLFNEAESEHDYRAAASRAYIAAFQHVLSHPKLSDFEKTGTSKDHRLVIEHLKKSSDKSLQKMGHQFLPRLRALRNRADYDLHIPFTKGLAEDALERATEIIYQFLPTLK